MVISNGAMKEVRGFEATLSVDKELKVGLISESFSLWLHNHIKSPQVKSKDYFGKFHIELAVLHCSSKFWSCLYCLKLKIFLEPTMFCHLAVLI